MCHLQLVGIPKGTPSQYIFDIQTQSHHGRNAVQTSEKFGYNTCVIIKRRIDNELRVINHFPLLQLFFFLLFFVLLNLFPNRFLNAHFPPTKNASL